MTLSPHQQQAADPILTNQDTETHVKISCIVACTINGGIGLNNSMPWDYPEDLKHFKKVTDGKAVVMGLNTYNSLPIQLPNRLSIVVTSHEMADKDQLMFTTSILEAIELARQAGKKEVVFIGGKRIYEESLSLCDTVYFTLIEGLYKTDTRLSEEFLDNLRDPFIWTQTRILPEHCNHNHHFYRYDRNQLPLF